MKKAEASLPSESMALISYLPALNVGMLIIAAQRPPSALGIMGSGYVGITFPSKNTVTAAPGVKYDPAIATAPPTPLLWDKVIWLSLP